MTGSQLLDRTLVLLFVSAFLTYGVGDVLSTFLALNHIYGSMEGLAVTANLISGGFTGYLILLALKTVGLLVFLAMALYGWRLAAKWSLLGFTVYGSYLTVSNLCCTFIRLSAFTPRRSTVHGWHHMDDGAPVFSPGDRFRDHRLVLKYGMAKNRAMGYGEKNYKDSKRAKIKKG